VQWRKLTGVRLVTFPANIRLGFMQLAIQNVEPQKYCVTGLRGRIYETFLQITNGQNKLECEFLARLLQPSVMFASKAGDQQSREPFRWPF
jgi:hypothetical protein